MNNVCGNFMWSLSKIVSRTTVLNFWKYWLEDPQLLTIVHINHIHLLTLFLIIQNLIELKTFLNYPDRCTSPDVLVILVLNWKESSSYQHIEIIFIKFTLETLWTDWVNITSGWVQVVQAYHQLQHPQKSLILQNFKRCSLFRYVNLHQNDHHN